MIIMGSAGVTCSSTARSKSSSKALDSARAASAEAGRAQLRASAEDGGRPIRASNVLTTLYSVLGIDPAATFPDYNGRPQYVLDAASLGIPKGWIMLGHAVSEEAGMLEMAQWIRTFVSEVPVQLVKTGEPFWAPTSPPSAPRK